MAISAASEDESLSDTSTMKTANKSALRASKLRLKTCSWSMPSASMPRACAAICLNADSGCGAGMRSSSVSDGASDARRTSTGNAVRGSFSSEIRIISIGGWACSYQADTNIIARTVKHLQSSVDNGSVKPARPPLVLAAKPLLRQWAERPHWRNVRTAQDSVGGNTSPPKGRKAPR